MKKHIINSKKGFTIIEVVLVLAIAGLIFLMVFVALPRLQVSQRDTQRRDDVAAVATAVTQYQSNNGGRTPNEDTDVDTFVERYLTANGAEFNDPLSGDPYTLAIENFMDDDAHTAISGYLANDAAGNIAIVAGAACGEEDGTLGAGAGTRSYAVAGALEGSGYYCTDN